MRFPKAPALVALLLASAAIGCGGTDQINWHGGAPRERTWKEFPPMNTAHSMAASVAVGNAIYVISGGSCAGAGGGVEWFQPGNSNAQPMNTPPAVARAAASAQNLDGRVFFIGGCTGNAASSEVDSFDFFAQVWSPATPMNVARYGFASGVLDGKIYVAGGGDSTTKSLSSAEAFDPTTNQWTPLPPLPVARQFPGGAVVDGKFFVIGGLDSSGTVTFADVDIYDPATNQWSSGRPLPTSRAGGAAALDGQIYVVGGQTGPFGNNAVQVYDPFYDIWFEAPPIPTYRIAAQPIALSSSIYVAGNVDPGETTLTSFEVLVPNDLTHAGSGFWNGECTGPGSCGGGGCVTGCSGSNHKGCGCSLESDGAASVGGPLLMALAGAAWLAMRRRRIAA